MKKITLFLLLFSCNVPEKDFLKPQDYIVLNGDFLIGYWKVEETTLDNLIPIDNIKLIVFKKDNVCLVNDVESHWQVQKDIKTINPITYTEPRLYLNERVYDIISNNKLISTKNNSIIILK